MAHVRNTTLAPFFHLERACKRRFVRVKQKHSIPPGGYDSYIFGETPGGAHESPEPIAFPCSVNNIFGQRIGESRVGSGYLNAVRNQIDVEKRFKRRQAI